MVLLSAITSKINRALAPTLLKASLKTRYALSRHRPIIVDNPYLDAFLLTPLSQTLISIEVQAEAEAKIKAKANSKESTSASTSTSTSFDNLVDAAWDKYLEPLSPSPPESKSQNNIDHYPTRLKVFNEYIRPVLTPNNKFQDINQWRFNNRFTKWLRTEYLICKYEMDIRNILKDSSKLRQSAQLIQARSVRSGIGNGTGVSVGAGSKLIDTMRRQSNRTRTKTTDEKITYVESLPSKNVLNDTFQMHNWNKTKSANREYEQMTHITTQLLNGTMHTIPGGAGGGEGVQIPDIDNDQDVESLTLDQVLEVAGCHVLSCNGFNALCDDAGIYEFWTDEYVLELSTYLMERCQRLHAMDDGKDIVIVEVGAGDGILSQFIRENIIQKRVSLSNSGPLVNTGTRSGKKKRKKRNKHGHGNNMMSTPTIVATDDMSYKIKPKANVEKLSVTEAMKKYGNEFNSKEQHLIVICSWMPMGVDWTKLFRDANVDEYILIGECDDGNCGHNWYTWGNVDFYMDENEEEGNNLSNASTTPRSMIPAYLIDGYERKELENLTKLQFSRFDSVVSSGSKTISFYKKD